MKKFYSLLAVAAFALSMNAQTQTVDFVFADQNWNNSQIISSGVIDENLNFTTSKNGSSNNPAYYAADKSLRFYFIANGNGGGMTITPNDGAIIKSITINAVSGNTPTVKYSVDETTSKNAVLKNGAYTISDIEASKSFMFQNANTSNTQLRITSISVTYSTKTMAVVDANASKINLVKNTVVSNEIIFGQTTKVSITNMNGQVVKTAEVNDNSRLNVSELAKGIYIVTATVNGKTVSQKIVKK
ncbi:T9SS type A sorting domain-containing protein [Chryseobacterium sp. T1]